MEVDDHAVHPSSSITRSQVRVLYSRWRIFGLVHVLSQMKYQQLDLPEAALTNDLDKPPSYLDSRNPWDWQVGDLSDYTLKETKVFLYKKGGLALKKAQATRSGEDGDVAIYQDGTIVNTTDATADWKTSQTGHGVKDAPLVYSGAVGSSGPAAGADAEERRAPEDESEFFEQDTSNGPVHPSNIPHGLDGNVLSRGQSSQSAEILNKHSLDDMISLKKKEISTRDNNPILWRLSKIVRENRILLTSVSEGSVMFLKNWLRRSKYFMKHAGFGIVLSNIDQDLTCRSVASGQLSKLDPQLEKYMCLPSLSKSTSFLSVLGYMRVGVLAGYDLAYVSIAHFWVKNPVPYLWPLDINIQTEFYNRFKTRPTLFSVKGTCCCSSTGHL